MATQGNTTQNDSPVMTIRQLQREHSKVIRIMAKGSLVSAISVYEHQGARDFRLDVTFWPKPFSTVAG
jgi:hypothetical protein